MKASSIHFQYHFLTVVRVTVAKAGGPLVKSPEGHIEANQDHLHSHVHKLEPGMLVIGQWEEAGEPEESRWRHNENSNSTRKDLGS